MLFIQSFFFPFKLFISLLCGVGCGIGNMRERMSEAKKGRKVSIHNNATMMVMREREREEAKGERERKGKIP